MREKIEYTIKQTALGGSQNKVDSIRRKCIQKTGCRVVKDNKIGVAGALGEANVDELFKKAENALEFGIEYPVTLTENCSYEKIIDDLKITDEDFLKKTETVLKHAEQKFPNFLASPQVKLSETQLRISNECGLDAKYQDRYIEFGVLFKGKESTGIIDTFFGAAERTFDVDKICTQVDELLAAHNNPVPLPSDAPIICAPSLLTPIFSRDLNGKMVGNKASLFAEKLGEVAFSKDFSLKIDQNSVETFEPAFDMEGTIVADELSFLVKNGKILRPYSDKKTAKKFGFENTGCAECAYDGVPTLSPRSWQVLPGGRSLKTILNGKPGIVVIMAGGGDFTPDGIYASPVQISYLHDGEKLVGKLPEFTIKGSIFDILGKDFIGVTSDRLDYFQNKQAIVTKMKIEPLQL